MTNGAFHSAVHAATRPDGSQQETVEPKQEAALFFPTDTNKDAHERASV